MLSQRYTNTTIHIQLQTGWVCACEHCALCDHTVILRMHPSCPPCEPCGELSTDVRESWTEMATSSQVGDWETAIKGQGAHEWSNWPACRPVSPTADSPCTQGQHPAPASGSKRHTVSWQKRVDPSPPEDMKCVHVEGEEYCNSYTLLHTALLWNYIRLTYNTRLLLKRQTLHTHKHTNNTGPCVALHWLEHTPTTLTRVLAPPTGTWLSHGSSFFHGVKFSVHTVSLGSAA